MSLLEIPLSVAVPLRIMELKARGGPTDSDFQRCHDFAMVLGEKGDILQFGSKKKGEAAALFNQLAQCLRGDGICSGGVRFGAEHWQAKPKGMPRVHSIPPKISAALAEIAMLAARNV